MNKAQHNEPNRNDLGADDLLQTFRTLRINRSGERRAPHKPLLLLIALGQYTAGVTNLTFPRIEELLTPLLKDFAPSVKNRPEPKLPLRSKSSDRFTVDRCDRPL